MKKDKVCVYPWSHVNINPNGDVWPCCHQRGDNIRVYGNFKKDNIDKIFNDEPAKELRRSMLKGVLPLDCSKCIDYEKLGIPSPRDWANKQPWAQEVIDNIPNITRADGSITDYKIKYWDLRWSNLCNMNCIMCDPEWSSLWTQDIKNKLSNFSDEVIAQDNMLTNWKNRINEDTRKVRHLPNQNWIDTHIHDVQSIYFAGGEPLIMNEHWYVLNKLVELNRFDVRIKYNTNMLKLDFKGQNPIDLWKNWDYKLLSVEGSIDETGKRAEWIRTGTVWETVRKNIEQVRDAGIQTFANTSIGCYNVVRLPELIDELYELYYTKTNENAQVNLNPVHNSWCSVQVLPDALKRDIFEKTKQWENKTKSRTNKLETIYAELQKPHDPDRLRKFFKRSAFIDLNKHSTLFDHIPEFAEINDQTGNLYEQYRDEFVEKSISKSNSSISSNLSNSVLN
tara:strand:+ start:6150 stop:7502 length:1353 start_codon:yes stop_codon:yes gene_type:complete